MSDKLMDEVMREFKEKFYSTGFLSCGVNYISYADVIAWLPGAIARECQRAQIEAYDNVLHLAHNTSHKQYAIEQITRLAAEIKK